MVWALCGLIIVIIGLAVLAASGKFGQVPAVVDDRPVPDLPEGEVSADDLRSVRFAVVPRGYSMRQVDQLLDRMAAQLEEAHKGDSTDLQDHSSNGTGPDTE
ncbi:DivIVA domain-containing protein [Cutibacterium equinum]|uniref:DivIVA domain-containing protein n=1 Tax=Cutibacterium equinum TaxID=3016342 RepID=A0ABY7QZK7_9ACTN|nr:DivIVA domain-containing protein [Cutibacterium equinum]WCC80486.1 DivIVA domain-containing protein [Cutibacterium equinum]